MSQCRVLLIGILRYDIFILRWPSIPEAVFSMFTSVKIFTWFPLAKCLKSGKKLGQLTNLSYFCVIFINTGNFDGAKSHACWIVGMSTIQIAWNFALLLNKFYLTISDQILHIRITVEWGLPDMNGSCHLATITGTTMLVSYPVVKSLQLIWRSGTRWWNVWVMITWLIWTIWTPMSSVQRRLINLITYSLVDEIYDLQMSFCDLT